MEFNSYFSVNNEDMPQDLLKSMKKNERQMSGQARAVSFFGLFTVELFYY